MQRFIRFWLLLLVISSLTACNFYSRPSGTMAWIDAPVDGLEIELGQPVTLEGHAASVEGVEHIEFWAADELLLSQSSLESTGTLTRFSHNWMPASAGSYTIQLFAYGQDGSISSPDSITLIVSQTEAVATTVSTPTWTPENTEIPASITPTLTPTPTPFVPTPTFTWIPPTDPPTEPPPADTTGPNPPNPISPTGKQMLGCSGSIVLNWSAASDPSGIDSYTVELERHSGDNNWSSAPGSAFKGISGTSTSVPVECGWYYRWRVRARDGAGNWGSFSSWAVFAVSLN